MKPNMIFWTIAFISISSFCYSQTHTACDTAIAGISVNMSLSANCQLRIDSSSAKYLTSNYSANMVYSVTVMDSNNEPMSMPLTEKEVGKTFKVMLIGGGCTPSNVGWSYVTLEDKFAPVIACKDTTLSCIDFRSYTTAGVDECNLDTIITIGLSFEPVCNPKIDSISTRVVRTYIARDLSGNADTCTEKILIKRLQESDIQFPGDLYDITCDTLSKVTDASGNLIAPPNNLTTGIGTQMDKYIFGVPTGSGSGTGSGTSFYGNNFKECRVRAYYKDISQYTNGCVWTYQRLWTVYEWYCDGEEVEYNHLQTITFKDTTPPTFELDTMYVSLDPDSCQAMIPFSSILLDSISDNCTPIADLKIKYEYFPHILGQANDTFIRVTGIDTVAVVVTITDNCGKSTTKEMTLITMDESSPVAICIGSINVGLINSDSTTVPIDSFNIGSYDPCGTITLSARKMSDSLFRSDFVTFKCSDPDTVMVMLQAMDVAGNKDICMIAVTLKKDSVDCTGFNSNSIAQLSGRVRFLDDLPAANINVNLGEHNVLTDKNGVYKANTPAGGELLSLMPVKDDHPEAGLSTLDIIYLQRHMLGIEDFDNGYQVIAADIDANDEINAADLLELRKLVLGDLIKFSKNTSYVFLPADMQFIDEMDPWANGGNLFGKRIRMTPGQYTQDFVGVKIGDVNNSLHRPEIRNRATINFNYDIIEMGRFIELNIYSDEDLNIDGLQATLSYNNEALKLMKVGKAQLNIDQSNYSLNMIDKGFIPISWNSYLPIRIDKNQPLMRLSFEKIYDTSVSFTFSDEALRSEVYIDKAVATAFLRPMLIENVKEFSITQNVPNPWENETSIEFAIPVSDNVKLNIYDASMRKVYKDEDQFPAGKNTFKVQYHNLPETGIFFYEIIYADQVRVSKMTKI